MLLYDEKSNEFVRMDLCFMGGFLGVFLLDSKCSIYSFCIERAAILEFYFKKMFDEPIHGEFRLSRDYRGDG